MGTTLAEYREATAPLPKSYLSWDLLGTGLENLGRNNRPVELPLRDPRDDEILLRVDAIGLCFSDTKLIWAGNEHPRIRGRDLTADPTVPGHEAAMTVVAVGQDWQDRFQVGERYAIQADIFIQGEQKAFGYVQRGALAQYVYAGPWVLAGDDGCYLLPLQASTGYAEAALVEPWTCVEAAYAIPQRDAPLTDGRILLVGAQPGLFADLVGSYDGPGSAVAVSLGGADWNGAPATCQLEPAGEATPAAVAAAVEAHTGGAGFDDILLLGDPEAALVEACDRALAKDGILCLLGAMPTAQIDIGRVHYQGTRHIGAPSGPIREPYTQNLRADIKGGGATWIIGAAGPMGQMHVQRALEHPEPPARIVCTDVSDERLAYMEGRLRPIAERRRIEFILLNPMSNPEGEAQLSAAAPDGFDDIDVMAPVAKLVEDAAPRLAVGGVMNIFAGVPLGTLAALPLETVAGRKARYIGSSGSPLEAMKTTLRKTEAGQLSTNYSLAAVGDIYQGWEGIQAVKEGRFPGKIVLFPQARDLPLTTLDRLGEVSPAASAALDANGIWSNAAETALLEERLAP